MMYIYIITKLTFKKEVKKAPRVCALYKKNIDYTTKIMISQEICTK